MIQGALMSTGVVVVSDETAALTLLLVQVVLEEIVVVVQRDWRDRELCSQDFFDGIGIDLPAFTRLSCSVPALGGLPAFHSGQAWKL